MANRPYQEKVDQFMADYQDKFLPTLITGKGTPEAPYTNMGGPEPPVPMSKDQAQLERDKILAASIHPDTFSRVLDVMKGVGKTALGTGEYLGLGMGYLPQRGQEAIESGLGIEPTKPPRWSSQRIGERMEELLPGGPTLRPITETGLGAAGYRFAPPTLADIQAAIPPDFARGGNVINMTPGPTGTFEAEKPVPGGWDWKGELAKQGTYSAGPERFFVGGREVPAGTPGAVSGDQLARERIGAGGGSAIPLSAMGEAPIPTGRAPEVPGYEMPGEIRTALQGIQKILMTPSGAIYSPSGRQAYAGGYRPHQINALENFAGTLEKMAATGAGYQTKMADIRAEAPGRAALAEYHRKTGEVHEKALPSETFYKYAMGEQALKESLKPWMMAPGTSYQNAEGKWVTAPIPAEKINPVLLGIGKEATELERVYAGSGVPFNSMGFIRDRLKLMKPAFGKEEISRFPREYLVIPESEYTQKILSGLKERKDLTSKQRKEWSAPEYIKKQYKDYSMRTLKEWDIE